MLDLYPTVTASPLFTREDTRRTAQALHTALRTGAFGLRQKRMEAVRPMVDRLLHDIRAGKVPSHPRAHVHLLGLLKEGMCYEEGVAHWRWLADQDNTFVDQAVYGAAIELLAYRGKDSLESLEELYMDGLKRFPGTYAEYHLSPEAVVPDRTQSTTIPGIPIAMLQAILTARLLSRDWKNAYLALDTALRLYPSNVPRRFFELFMRERPLPEAYTIFLIACRSGVAMSSIQLTTLITKLRTAMFKLPGMHDRIAIVQGMANAIYAHLEAGGTIEAPHIGSLLTSFQHLIPRSDPKANHDDNREHIIKDITTSAREILTDLLQSGVTAHPQMFFALTDLAGRFQIPELFQSAIDDIQKAQIEIGDIGRRVLLLGAADLRDVDLVRNNWESIVQHAESEGSQLSMTDWVTLARACRRAGCTGYFEEQLQTLKHAIDQPTEQQALSELNEKEVPPREPKYLLMDWRDFTEEMDSVKETMRNVAAIIMSQQPLNLEKNPFFMFLDPQTKWRLSDSPEGLRAVYNELSTDPHQPPAQVSSIPVAVSPTGLPLDELRFQNWVTVLELMREAEVAEQSFQARLDTAIAEGKPVKAVPYNPTTVMSAFRDRQPKTLDESDSDAQPGSSVAQLREIVRGFRSLNTRPVTPRRVQTKADVPQSARDSGSMRFYVGLQSDHSAPAPDPTKLSARPIKSSVLAQSRKAEVGSPFSVPKKSPFNF
jgi:hypothetical protein